MCLSATRERATNDQERELPSYFSSDNIGETLNRKFINVATMFSKNKHWKNIPYVYTMFLSWDRRSQDGFPAVLYFDILIFDINIGFMEID